MAYMLDIKPMHVFQGILLPQIQWKSTLVGAWCMDTGHIFFWNILSSKYYVVHPLLQAVFTGWPKKVSHYHEPSLDRIKTRY